MLQCLKKLITSPRIWTLKQDSGFKKIKDIYNQNVDKADIFLQNFFLETWTSLLGISYKQFDTWVNLFEASY